MTEAAGGRIAERGYRRYDGPRLGPGHAAVSLYRHTLQRIFGLHRPARSKVLPFLSILIAYLPAAVFIGLVALLPAAAEGFVPDYEDYFGFVSAAIILFVTFVAPEALCPDRRSRVLSIYLASPLTRTTYLMAKVAAVTTALMLVTTGPLLLLLVGKALQGVGPDRVGGFASLFLRIVGSGFALAACYAALSLGISSLTDRRAFASGASLLIILGSNVVAAILVGGLQLPEAYFLLSASVTPLEMAGRIINPSAQGLLDVSNLMIGAAWGAYLCVGFGIAWIRYLRLRVTR